MPHEHDLIVLSGPWPLPLQPDEAPFRDRYVLNTGCRLCHWGRELQFVSFQDRGNVSMVAFEIEQFTNVRFATETELVQYHAEKRR